MRHALAHALHGGATVALLLAAVLPAAAQSTRSVAAVASTLGAIPNGGVRRVQFVVPDAGVARTVVLAVTLSHERATNLVASLASPDGRAHTLIQFQASGGASLAGTYVFADAASQTFYDATYAAGFGTVPPGSYATAGLSGGRVSMNASFLDAGSAGTWTLTLIDFDTLIPSGSVTGASLTLGLAAGAVTAATPATLGFIPDGLPGVQLPGPPRNVTFTVPPGRGPVRSVRVDMWLSHPWMGDVVAELIAPNGAYHVLFGATGAVNTQSAGSSTDLYGKYAFSDSAAGPGWWATAASQTLQPEGVYRTSRIGGAANGGQATAMDPVFAGGPSAGVWTLRLTDGSQTGLGQIATASLSLSTVEVPAAHADTFAASYGTTLAIPAPGVLGNDDDRLAGPMTAALISAPTSGSISLAASGGFTYTPRPGFAGTDTFTYRPANASGPGAVVTNTIVVSPPAVMQAPLDFRVASIVGDLVTLRWTPVTVGPQAHGYTIEGGLAPGQTVGSIAVAATRPVLTFRLPTGVFFLRMFADDHGMRVGPSNEISVYVNTPAPPSAPTSLTGMATGSAVQLSWRNTLEGGAPGAMALEVTGSGVAATVPLALSDTFAVAGVPPGVYTFRVRGANAVGASAASDAVTLAFPSGCTGAPAAPPNLLAYVTGNVVHVLWDPPASGPAAASYVLTVTGAVTATVPFTTRELHTAAPPGTYTFTVAGTNACGTGPATVPQTVVVP